MNRALPMSVSLLTFATAASDSPVNSLRILMASAR